MQIILFLSRAFEKFKASIAINKKFGPPHFEKGKTLIEQGIMIGRGDVLEGGDEGSSLSRSKEKDVNIESLALLKFEKAAKALTKALEYDTKGDLVTLLLNDAQRHYDKLGASLSRLSPDEQYVPFFKEIKYLLILFSFYKRARKKARKRWGLVGTLTICNVINSCLVCKRPPFPFL